MPGQQFNHFSRGHSAQEHEIRFARPWPFSRPLLALHVFHGFGPFFTAFHAFFTAFSRFFTAIQGAAAVSRP